VTGGHISSTNWSRLSGKRKRGALWKNNRPGSLRKGELMSLTYYLAETTPRNQIEESRGKYTLTGPDGTHHSYKFPEEE